MASFWMGPQTEGRPEDVLRRETLADLGAYWPTGYEIAVTMARDSGEAVKVTVLDGGVAPW